MKKAKVTYNNEKETYEIYINTGDGWGFESSFKCVEKKDSKTGNKDFIHFSIISKLAEMQWLGYEISFRSL